MSESNTQDGETPPEDRSSDTLTPQEAYRLRENVGLKNKTVANMFDVSPGYVSQLYGQYEEAKQEGAESVTPSDFDRETLESAIADEPPEEDIYHTTCPACDSKIPKPESAGEHPCPECGKDLQWSADEL